MNVRKVKFSIFDGYEMGLFIDEESFNEYLDSHGIDNPAKDYLGVVLEPEGSAMLLFVGDDSILTAAHESLHAAMCLLNIKGIFYDYNNQEILAYTQQYILGELLDFMGYENILVGNMNKDDS